jgi:REP element-mobilizing transposase RayT
MARTAQRCFEFRTWGGARDGAGAPRRRERRALPHRAREAFTRATPVHVTLRMAPHVWNLRSERSFRILHDSLAAIRERPGLRVVDFTILGNHLHFVVEADGSPALARGIRALSIRLARRLNRMMGRRGPVFEDRYFTPFLRTSTEVRNALDYIRRNYARHATSWGEKVSAGWKDPYTSAVARTPRVGQQSLWPEPITAGAKTWLLRRGRKRAG